MYHYRHLVLVVTGLFVLMAAGLLPARAAGAASGPLCFPQTAQCIDGRFRDYWEQNGGLPVFGYPVSAALDERNRDTGQTYLTQWFERNRFELHPEYQPPYDVLLGRLGDDQLLRQGRIWQREPREAGPQAGCLWFAQTGHNVCDQASLVEGQPRGFKTYWQTHGLHDPGLDAYRRSLALFGLPLTAPRTETNSSGDTVLTQWFERARFEWHPSKPVAFSVLLGLLGNELRTGQGLVPSFFYVSAGALFDMTPTGTIQQRGAIADLGRVLDALRLPDSMLLLCEQGLQRVLPAGPPEVIARFEQGAALFGRLVPTMHDPRVIYAYQRQRAGTGQGREAVIGIYAQGDNTARRVLVTPRPALALGLTPDGQGIYLIRQGQDPSYTGVDVINAADGRTIRTIPVSGEGGAQLSSDRRTLMAIDRSKAGAPVLRIDVLSTPPSNVGFWPLPAPMHAIQGAIWAQDGRNIYALLARTNRPDEPLSVYRLDSANGQAVPLVPYVPAGMQIATLDANGRWLIARDERGMEVRLIDLVSSNAITRTIPAEAVIARWN